MCMVMKVKSEAAQKIITLHRNLECLVLTENVPDAGKDWGQKEKRESEDEIAVWHHWCNWHELGQALRDGEGQEAWHAAVHGVAKSQTWLGDLTTIFFYDFFCISVVSDAISLLSWFFFVSLWYQMLFLFFHFLFCLFEISLFLMNQAKCLST